MITIETILQFMSATTNEVSPLPGFAWHYPILGCKQQSSLDYMDLPGIILYLDAIYRFYDWCI